MVIIKRIILLTIFSTGALLLNAQDIKVITSGQGMTQDEATRVALRNALEDAFGTFLSASTKIENNVLVSDEITSLTQGNIKKYDIINSSILENSIYSVTVKSIVSLNELYSYCESKGISVEFNGSAFDMNLKIKEFNKNSERKILKNLCFLLLSMNPQIFDFELKMAEPKVKEGDVVIPVLIVPECNTNYNQCRRLVESTLQSLSLSKNEIKEYKNIGLEYFSISLYSNSKVYYLRDENNIKIFTDFFNEFRTRIISNWELNDGIIAKPFSFTIVNSRPFRGNLKCCLYFSDSRCKQAPRGLPVDKNYIKGMNVEHKYFSLSREVSSHFGSKYSRKHDDFQYYPKRHSLLFSLYYPRDVIGKLNSFKLEPFNKVKYENATIYFIVPTIVYNGWLEFNVPIYALTYYPTNGITIISLAL